MRLTQYVKASTILILLLCVSLSGFDQKNWQWQPLGVFDGGLNIESAALLCPSNQLVSVDNFVWRKDHLEGRQGKWRLQQPLSALPVLFIKPFKTSTGIKYLFYSDGVHLWYIQSGSAQDALTGTSVQLYPGDAANFKISEMVVINDVLWIYSNIGTYYFAGPSVFVGVDSATVSYRLRAPFLVSQCPNYTAGPRYLEFTGSGIVPGSAGQYLHLTTNSVAYAVGGNPIPAGHTMYLSYPITSVTDIRDQYTGDHTTRIKTRAAAFVPLPDSSSFLVETLVYDSTTKYGVTLDSVQRVATSISAPLCGNDSIYYLKL